MSDYNVVVQGEDKIRHELIAAYRIAQQDRIKKAVEQLNALDAEQIIGEAMGWFGTGNHPTIEGEPANNIDGTFWEAVDNVREGYRNILKSRREDVTIELKAKD